eukprot:1716968-Rhodomonas_salina.1
MQGGAARSARRLTPLRLGPVDVGGAREHVPAVAHFARHHLPAPSPVTKPPSSRFKCASERACERGKRWE